MRKLFIIYMVIITTFGTLTFLISNAVSGEISLLHNIQYFSTQGNILVTLYFIILLIKGEDLSLWVKKLIAPFAVYIIIVFFGYFIFLEPIYNPTGMILVGNIMIHYVTPFFTVLYLILYGKEYPYEYREIKYWSIYFLLFIVYGITKGLLTDIYLYPFIDINELGVLPVLITLSVMVIELFILSYIIVFYTKKTTNKKSR